MRRGKNPGRDSEDGALARWLCRALVALAALFPFIVWPGTARPFSTPKIVLLGGFTVVGAICAVATRNFRWPELPRGFCISLIAWPCVLALSALLGEFVSQNSLWLPLISTGWFLLVVTVQPRAEVLGCAIAVSCAITAAIALLQYMGLDPFRLLGWATPPYESPRMRVFGTLGNPNFVAAFLIGGMPLVILLRNWATPRVLFPFMVVLQVAALFATGSRAAVAGVIATAVWLGALGRFRKWRLLVAVAVLLVSLLPLMPSRSLATTLTGRLYIWRVTAPHLFERPVFGFGPGGFEPKFIEWETGYWRDGKVSGDLRQFAGLQAHAHNDYLEILVDHGFIGLFSLLLLLGSFLLFAFQQSKKSEELSAAASAGVVALATVALVDFPLHRPTELFLFWTLMALVFLCGKQAPGHPESRRRSIFRGATFGRSSLPRGSSSV